jgi:hypothetical protein
VANTRNYSPAKHRLAFSNKMADYNWELLDDQGYLDQPAFAEYAVTVLKAIQQLARKGIKATIAAQRRQMGDNFIIRYHMDALDSLEAAGTIAKASEVSPLRWLSQTPPERNTRPNWNTSGRVPTDRTFPVVK